MSTWSMHTWGRCTSQAVDGLHQTGDQFTFVLLFGFMFALKGGQGVISLKNDCKMLWENGVYGIYYPPYLPSVLSRM